MTDPDLGRRALEEGLLKQDEFLKPAPPQPASAPERPPTRLGRYEIVRLLGRGAAGEVYLARDPSVNREVAVKVLRGADFDQRFRREVEILGALRHPNIVALYDAGTENGLHYFVMERIEGRTLQEALRAGDLPPRDRVAILRDVSLACQAAHEKGVVHRDLKPSNILLDRKGHPYITDFGIAKVIEARERMTMTGTALGTPHYMSPEQASGKAAQLDARSDVFSLGVILYEMLAGTVPFAGRTFLEIAHKIVGDEPRRPSRLNPSTPAALEAVALKAMEKAPDRRYATARAFADDLQCWIDGRPVSARPPGPVRRLARWCRRHPVRLALAASAVVLLVVLAMGAKERARIVRQRVAVERVNEELQKIAAWDVQLYKPPKFFNTAELSPPVEALRELLGTGNLPPDQRHRAFCGIARAEERMGRADLALEDYGKAIRLAPPGEAALYRFERARILWEIVLREAISQREVRNAGGLKEDLRTALEIGLEDPWQRDFAQLLLEIVEKQDKETLEKKIKETCARLREAKGKPAEEAWKLQGDIALFTRRPLQAEIHYASALKIRQSYVQAKLGLAMSVLAEAVRLPEAGRTKRLQDALDHALGASEMCPRYGETYELFWLACRTILFQKPGTWTKHGDAAREISEPTLRLFERGRQARPDLAAVELGLGTVHLVQGSVREDGPELDDAAKAFERALRIAPDSADARAGLGLTHLARGDSRRALEQMEKAIELDPSLRNALKPALDQAKGVK